MALLSVSLLKAMPLKVKAGAYTFDTKLHAFPSLWSFSLLLGCKSLQQYLQRIIQAPAILRLKGKADAGLIHMENKACLWWRYCSRRGESDARKTPLLLTRLTITWELQEFEESQFAVLAHSSQSYDKVSQSISSADILVNVCPVRRLLSPAAVLEEEVCRLDRCSASPFCLNRKPSACCETRLPFKGSLCRD